MAKRKQVSRELIPEMSSQVNKIKKNKVSSTKFSAFDNKQGKQRMLNKQKSKHLWIENATNLVHYRS